MESKSKIAMAWIMQALAEQGRDFDHHIAIIQNKRMHVITTPIYVHNLRSIKQDLISLMNLSPTDIKVDYNGELNYLLFKWEYEPVE